MTARLPADPVLRDAAEQLEAQRHIAEVWDADWRLAYLTSDYELSVGAGAPPSVAGIGERIDSARTAAIRAAWPAGPTPESFVAVLAAVGPAIRFDRDGAGDGPAPLQLLRTEVKFGNATRPYHSIGVRLQGHDGRFAGTATVVVPALPGSVLSLLGTGDHETLERLLALLRPAERPGAVLFVDLEGSSTLARRLSTADYFALLRRLVFRIDEAVVSRAGVVGKHAGDGASAFFLAEMVDRPARTAIEAARSIRAAAPAVAERSGLEPSDVSVRAGLHWGASMYVGRLLTGGRAEVTALGREVNDTARIEASATGGRILASRALIDQLDPADAAALALGTPVFTRLADLPGATAKAVRDAADLEVTVLGGF